MYYVNTFVWVEKNQAVHKKPITEHRPSIHNILLRYLFSSKHIASFKIAFYCISTTPYISFYKNGRPAFIDLNSIWVALGLTWKTVIESPLLQASSLSRANIIWAGVIALPFAVIPAPLFFSRKDLAGQKAGKCWKRGIFSVYYLWCIGELNLILDAQSAWHPKHHLCLRCFWL